MLGSSSFRRALIAGALIAAALGLAACQNTNLVLVVNAQGIGPDANPGDGVCEEHTGVGDCSLPAAVEEGNTSLQVPQIVLPIGEFRNFNAPSNLTIDPASGSMLIVEAEHQAFASTQITNQKVGDLFDVQSGTLALDGLDLVHAGPASNTDAATSLVRVRAGATAILHRIRLRGRAMAVDVEAGGTANLRNAFVLQAGGGDPSGPAPSAAAIYNDGTATIDYATFMHNPGTGIGGSGTTTLRASVFSANGSACAAPVVSGGYNLEDDNTCGLGAPTDLVNTDPGISDISEDGHPLVGSPALDSIPAASPGLCGDVGFRMDLRTVPRPSGAGCDRGAFEMIPGLQLVVNSSVDQHDANRGDQVCATAAGTCTLRAAADEINATPPDYESTVTLTTDPVLTIPPAQLFNNNETGDVNVIGSVKVLGQGHILSGGGIDAVLSASNNLTLDHATITGGVGPDFGGVAGSDNVTLIDSVVTGNTAVGFDDPGSGGGGGVLGGSSVTLIRSSVTNNSAAGSGGGVYSFVVTAIDSTISGNHAVDESGGFLAGIAKLTNTTVADNSSGTAGGGRALETLVMKDSTVTGNTGQPTLVVFGTGSESSIQNSLVSAAPGTSLCGGAAVPAVTATLSSPTVCFGSTVVPSLQLGVLQNNGGPTLTQLPVPTSPAVNVGVCLDDHDQRGFPRPSGAVCDLGSVERQPTDP